MNVMKYVAKYIHWVTTLWLTIQAYLHSFSSYCLQNQRNLAKFELIEVQGHPMSSSRCQSKAHMQLPNIINSKSGHISYRFRDINAFSSKITSFHHPTLVWRP